MLIYVFSNPHLIPAHGEPSVNKLRFSFIPTVRARSKWTTVILGQLMKKFT